jgi:hypothetical protein
MCDCNDVLRECLGLGDEQKPDDYCDCVRRPRCPNCGKLLPSWPHPFSQRPRDRPPFYLTVIH